MAALEMKSPVILDIPADPASLFLVRALTAKISEQLGFAQQETDRVVLALDEACANVIRHAYKGLNEERIVITFNVSDECLEILVRDFGTPADPETFQPRDLADVRPGGLGIHFMRSAMDTIEYSAPEDGGMLLKMIKYRPKEVSEP